MHESQRYAAIIIDKILGGTNLDIAFENVFRNVKGLEHKSQTKAITYGALRYMGQSKYLIKSLVRKKIENRLVESLIHVALFQLSHESHNDFTIVDQAVKATKKIDLRKSNFVNAVLRNFLRNKDALTKGFLNQEEGQFNYPIWWIQKVKKQYKSDWENILNIGNGHPPMTIRVNKRKIITKEYKKLLKENKIPFIALANEGLILKDAKNIKDIPGFDDGLFSIQDFGAQLASTLLDLKNNYLVLDACAAPGGKTTSMLENSNINLIALEKSTQRAKQIVENLKRLNFKTNITNIDINNLEKKDICITFDDNLLCQFEIALPSSCVNT